MPIEGVSFQNSGFQPLNPADMTVQVEAASKAEAQKKIKETTKSDETKEDNEDSDEEKRDLQGRYTDDSSDDDTEGKDKAEKFLKSDKRFNVRFNSSTEMVEIVNAGDGNVIETISPDSLIKILSNSKAFSGILVDRKI